MCLRQGHIYKHHPPMSRSSARGSGRHTPQPSSVPCFCPDRRSEGVGSSWAAPIQVDGRVAGLVLGPGPRAFGPVSSGSHPASQACRGARASDSASPPATWKEPYSHWLLCTSARHHPFWLKAGSGWGPIACLPRQDSFFKQLLVKKLAGSYRKTHLSYHSTTEGYRQTPRTCSPWISASLH